MAICVAKNGTAMLDLEDLETFVEVADAGAYRQLLAGSVCQNPSSAVGWSGLKQDLVSSFSRGRPAGPRSPKRA
jgi:hypothetical protein